MPQTDQPNVPEKTKPKSNLPQESSAAPPQSSSDANEGEGNVTAARRYNQATEEYERSGRADEAAKAAKKALEGPEREELERAEREGRAHASDVEREADSRGLDAEREAPGEDKDA
jgi:hypothetical protein